MFRIDVHNDRELTSFTVEGKLTSPWATELEKCWQTVTAADPVKPIVVNLASVSFIDLECIELLTRMRRQGVKLVPTGCLMKVIVEQIEAEVAKDSQLSRGST